jgi:hypothetical protein
VLNLRSRGQRWPTPNSLSALVRTDRARCSSAHRHPNAVPGAPRRGSCAGSTGTRVSVYTPTRTRRWAEPLLCKLHKVGVGCIWPQVADGFGKGLFRCDFQDDKWLFVCSSASFLGVMENPRVLRTPALSTTSHESINLRTVERLPGARILPPRDLQNQPNRTSGAATHT